MFVWPWRSNTCFLQMPLVAMFWLLDYYRVLTQTCLESGLNFAKKKSFLPQHPPYLERTEWLGCVSLPTQGWFDIGFMNYFIWKQQSKAFDFLFLKTLKPFLISFIFNVWFHVYVTVSRWHPSSHNHQRDIRQRTASGHLFSQQPWGLCLNLFYSVLLFCFFKKEIFIYFFYSTPHFSLLFSHSYFINEQNSMSKTSNFVGKPLTKSR